MVSEQHRSYAAAVVMEASSHGNQAENARTSSNQRSDEFDDPFYLHATENPNLSLVSPPLTELNYSSWSRSMKIALEVKNKFGFVDGKIPSPDENDPKYASWRRCNRIVSSWMLRSLNPSIADGMMYFDKASDIWNALQKRYSQSDPHRISFLLCECTPTCSCTLLMRMKKEREEDQIIRFLEGLNEDYETVKSGVLVMDPIPDIERVLNMTCGMVGHTVEKCYKKHGYPLVGLQAINPRTDNSKTHNNLLMHP